MLICNHSLPDGGVALIALTRPREPCGSHPHDQPYKVSTSLVSSSSPLVYSFHFIRTCHTRFMRWKCKSGAKHFVGMSIRLCEYVLIRTHIALHIPQKQAPPVNSKHSPWTVLVLYILHRRPRPCARSTQSCRTWNNPTLMWASMARLPVISNKSIAVNTVDTILKHTIIQIASYTTRNTHTSI